MPHAVEPTSLSQAAAAAQRLLQFLNSRCLGRETEAELLVAAFAAGGHVLLEGTPGLGKTLLVRALSEAVDLSYGRIQCTPDLMPSDITGSEILDQQAGGSFRFIEGPVFHHVLLVDEINRATPRAQSALLEAMEERQVTAAGVSRPLPAPFFVAATQNPIELEGTYPLPEAQLDRFLLHLSFARPSTAHLERILAQPDAPKTVAPILSLNEVQGIQNHAASLPVTDGQQTTLANIIAASHADDESAPLAVREHVRLGASPRAGLAAIQSARGLALLRGRSHVAPEDLRDALPHAFRHRLLLQYETAGSIQGDEIMAAILDLYPVR